MTANELSKRFLIWFQQNNPEAKIYRNNAGCVKTEKGFVRYGIPNKGGADWIAFVPKKNYFGKSKFLSVEFYEIKTAKDKMSKDQIGFANMIAEMGGNYFIVHEINIKNKSKMRTIESLDCVLNNKRDNPESPNFVIKHGFYLEKWSLI